MILNKESKTYLLSQRSGCLSLMSVSSMSHNRLVSMDETAKSSPRNIFYDQTYKATFSVIAIPPL